MLLLLARACFFIPQFFSSCQITIATLFSFLSSCHDFPIPFPFPFHSHSHSHFMFMTFPHYILPSPYRVCSGPPARLKLPLGCGLVQGAVSDHLSPPQIYLRRWAPARGCLLQHTNAQLTCTANGTFVLPPLCAAVLPAKLALPYSPPTAHRCSLRCQNALCSGQLSCGGP